MKSLFNLFILALLITACEQEPDRGELQIIDLGGLTVIEGGYVGTFERDGSIANVSLEFNDSSSTFSGMSDMNYFPAIGSGNYSFDENKIIFEDQNVWTANFDWTLILNLEWEIEHIDNTLIFTNSTGDKYTLTKE